MLYIVTVKLAKNPKHDPRNKKTGKCPAGVGTCTDVAGEHHSFLFGSDDPRGIEYVRENWKDYHITRIEEVRIELRLQQEGVT